MKKNQSQHLETRVIHAGQSADPQTGAVMTPIYATSTYVQTSPGEHKGFEYSRSQNPTRLAYEQCIADLENGIEGFAFASGMAAIATLIETLQPGDHVVAMNDVYGGTFRIFEQVRKYTAGIDCSFVDFGDLQAITDAIRPDTKMLWVESPSNPLLRIVDLKEIASIAKTHGIIAVCDNTFATPIIQQPLNFGFDAVIHSATKYLGGHSDIISGVLAISPNNKALADRVRYLQNAIGAVPSPFDCFLALRGLKTLALRMERHSSNAQRIAEWLEKQPQIKKVNYPGLPSHPQHALASQQMRLYGGMISMELDANLKQTKKMLESCGIFQLAESLGGVESLIEHPAIMTHATIPKEIREASGITDSFIRLSVGIENSDDLIHDLEAALASI